MQRLVDIAIERATEGVSVPIFWRGEQVGEKRWFNDRLLMFVLRHHVPDRYGTSLRPGTRHPDTIAREAAENCPVCKAREAGEPDKDDEAVMADILRKYDAKVRSERHYRLTGQIVAADYALRQLTHIELILACGGKAMELIDLWTQRPTESGRGFVEPEADPVSEMLDRIRQKAWAAAGDPPRPPLPLDRRECMGSELWGGPTMREREKARQAAEAKMARAQREWEAAQREESWAEWKGANG